MCGIVGFHGQGNLETVQKMADAIKHRGPDDAGFYNFQQLYLGFRRLSIIDLSLGHQPLSNEDETVWIVFNGEIYNFQELKAELESQGHKFKTQTDTEVMVHLYEQKGDNFLAELNGMFALAIWDQKQSKLLLARDRLGKKPLYYGLFSETLIFASEIKALLQHPLVKKDLNFVGLGKYLSYEYVPAPQTIIKDINKLEAGHLLLWQNRQLVDRAYWDIGFDRLPLKAADPIKIQTQFEASLSAAVKKRLVADVPLGIFLSGGLDSSTIAYFAQKNSTDKIKTFSIGFADKSFDETPYSNQVARFLNTEHYHRDCSPQDLLDALAAISQINDEPFADASVIPTHLLSEFTRKEVTVALSGDGGDELLAGYPTFQAMRLAQYLRLFPSSLLDSLETVINLLPVSFNNFSFDFKLKRLFSGHNLKPELQNQAWLGSFLPSEEGQLLTTAAREQSRPEGLWLGTERLLDNVRDQPLNNRLVYLYLKQYLADDILVKADRASMYNSLEIRAPFLDYQLVDFLNSVPYNLKLRGFTGKYLLKQLMSDKLPSNIVNRPKKGFGIPVAKWINEELGSWVDGLLSPAALQQQGIFEPNYIARLLGEHRQRRADHRKKIWTLLMFQVWYNYWLK